MQNSANLFQSDSCSSTSAEYDDFNMDDLLLGDDYLNYLVGADVNLATLNTPVESDNGFSSLLQESKPVITKCETFPLKSPWHESDSGLSESLSFVESPPDPNLAGNAEDIFNVEAVAQKGKLNQPHMSTNTMASDDLIAYLFDQAQSNTHEMSNKKSVAKATQENNVERTGLSASGRPVRKRAKSKLWGTRPEYCDSDDSNSGDQGQMSGKQKSTSAVPLSHTNESSKHSRANVVNLIKIVKSPSNTTSDITTPDIIQALDEKSKKNAQQAKINREKKKLYIQNLENDRESLMKENNKLSSKLEVMTEEKLHLEAEVEYLKSVLVNSSALSGLLKNISNVKEVKLSASIMNRKREFENDHSYNLVRSRPEKKARMFSEKISNPGVCLHVSNGEACLEFCAHCSSLAHATHNS